MKNFSNSSPVKFDQSTFQAQTTWIAFVGSHLTFSKHYLGILAAEHDDMDFLRVCSFRDLDQTIAVRGNPFMIIMDEPSFLPLFEEPAALIDILQYSLLAVAYRDNQTVAQLIAKTSRFDGLSEIGVLPLNAEIEVWLAILNLLLCGEVVYPNHALVSSLPVPFSRDAETSVGLTHREWEVLEMVSKGQQNKLIAANLDVTEHTVKLHVHHVLKKLGVSNRAAAAGWFAQRSTEL